MLGRLYKGKYSILIVYDTDTGEEYAFTEPDIYEECEKRIILHGMGIPFEGKRVKRALIVGPVVE